MPALGLLLLGYPLHAAGRPDQPRVEHFPRMRVPVLFAERNPRFARLQAGAHEGSRHDQGRRSSTGSTRADHGYRPLKSSGRTADEVLAEVGAVSAEWVRTLPD